MAPQHFNNHIRFYTPHHFIFYPVMLLMETAAIYKIITDPPLRAVWIFLALLTVITTWLSYMLRQHYALTLQNRLVVLEMRQRYFVLTGNSFEPLEGQLSFAQIAALRFAPDEELQPLIEKALAEALPARTIKQHIKNWKADTMRV